MIVTREAYLWTSVGVVIFAVLIALYIDDHIKMARESQAVPDQLNIESSAGHNEPPNVREQEAGNQTTAAPSSGSNHVTSLNLNEYLAKAEGKMVFSDGYGGAYTEDAHAMSIDGDPASENGADTATSDQHTGFYGSYEEYARKYR